MLVERQNAAYILRELLIMFLVNGNASRETAGATIFLPAYRLYETSTARTASLRRRLARSNI
ncbi:MAG: hypothetical protein LBC68_02725 [Prevotellaceae bacterium]|nr:hypothetical protein [Prevotellaceae bacterium]